MEIKELKNCKLLEDAVSPVQSRRHSQLSHSILSVGFVFLFKQNKWLAE